MTTTTTSGYKLLRRLKGTGFNPRNLPDYTLSIQVGITDLQVCICDKTQMSCEFLEDYLFENVRTTKDRTEVVKTILDEHPLLKSDRWRNIRLVVKTHKFTLVPVDLFIEEYASDYLTLNADIKSNLEEVYYYQIPSANLVNIFAADRRLIKLINGYYSEHELQVICQSSAWITGLLKDATVEKKSHFLMDKGIFHLAVLEGQKLLYYNQFAARESQDYVKFPLLVFKELGLNPKTDPMIVSGMIKEDASQLKGLKKYFGRITLGTRPSFLSFGEKLQDLPAHSYYDNYSASICD